MTLRRMAVALAAGLSSLVVTLASVTLLLTSPGCVTDERAPLPPAPLPGTEVVGTLVALKDDRPVDGGIDLTLETEAGVQKLVRVPSIFLFPPRDSVRAMHEVVDASKLGDRIRARGTTDESGALKAEVLEKLPQ